MEKRSCYRKRIRCLFHVQRCRHGCSFVVLSAAEGSASPVILTVRSEWRDLPCSLSFHRKRGMEKRSCYRKTHSLPFPFLFFYTNADLSRRLFCHLERQSRGLLTEADSSTPGLGPTLGMTEKAKTVGKRNSFPGFSFFECPSFALFLFLSCGDADVSSAFGFVVLVCIFIYFCL